MKNSYKCECGREFKSLSALGGHKSHCKIYQILKHGSLDSLNNSDSVRHQKLRNTLKIKQVKTIEYNRTNELNQLQKWISEQHRCERCGKIMIEKYGSGRFCSKSCAHVRDMTSEIIHKISETAKNNSNEHPEWFGFHNKQANEVQMKYFSSKKERELRKILQNEFPQYNFTTGIISHMEYNDKIYRLCPDIWSNSLKIIIEYDGIWHFKDIHNQLERK